jgi:hypothetical protein
MQGEAMTAWLSSARTMPSDNKPTAVKTPARR